MNNYDFKIVWSQSPTVYIAELYGTGVMGDFWLRAVIKPQELSGWRRIVWKASVHSSTEYTKEGS